MRRDGFQFTYTSKPAEAAIRHMKTSRLSKLKFTRASPWAFGAALAVSCAIVPSAEGHGFGQRYDLPLPLSLYLFAAAAAVVVSFIIVGLFVRGTASRTRFDQRFD